MAASKKSTRSKPRNPKKKAVYEIGLNLQIEMSAHSINNEGISGNILEPRKYATSKGKIVDGVSGAMLKHIFVKSLWDLEEDKKGNLCDGCRVQDGRKVSISKTPGEYDQIIKRCVICDTTGFMVSQKKQTTKEEMLVEKFIKLSEQIQDPDTPKSKIASIKGQLKKTENKLLELDIDINNLPKVSKAKNFRRDSVVRFSSALAIQSNTQYNRRLRETVDHEMEGQVVLVENSRSGIYAISSAVDVFRIGYNDPDFEYTLSPKERKRRYDMVLGAYKRMFIKMNGARSSSNMPHLSEIKGCLSVNYKPGTLGMVSALDPDFIETNRMLTEGSIYEFNGFKEFVNAINCLISGTEPYQIKV